MHYSKLSRLQCYNLKQLLCVASSLTLASGLSTSPIQGFLFNNNEQFEGSPTISRNELSSESHSDYEKLIDDVFRRHYRGLEPKRREQSKLSKLIHFFRAAIPSRVVDILWNGENVAKTLPLLLGGTDENVAKTYVLRHRWYIRKHLWPDIVKNESADVIQELAKLIKPDINLTIEGQYPLQIFLKRWWPWTSNEFIRGEGFCSGVPLEALATYGLGESVVARNVSTVAKQYRAILLDTLPFLTSKGHKVVDEDGNTPLHMCFMNDCVNSVLFNVLVTEFGFNPDKPNKWGVRPSELKLCGERPSKLKYNTGYSLKLQLFRRYGCRKTLKEYKKLYAEEKKLRAILM